MAPKSSVPLTEGWTFREHTSSSKNWLPVAQFPTNIHLDLLAHNLIPDPFHGKNENQVQWVGERSWAYRTTFRSPPIPSGAKAVLNFEGLDTYATVILNGKKVLDTDNMFRGYRVEVSGALLAGEGENELEIVFESAFLRGKRIEEEHPEHRFGCWNGDRSRLAVRKAQYHYVGFLDFEIGELS